MAPISIPETGISLEGAGRNQDAQGKHTSTSAILLRLTDALVEDMRVAAQNKRLHFDAGKAPKLRLGTKTLSLSLTPPSSANELHLASPSLSTLSFSHLITHRAELQPSGREGKDDQGTAGADAALANLRSNLASMEQDKQANAVAISKSVQATPKNRFEAAKTHKQVQRSLLSGNNGGGSSPSVGGGGAGAPRGLAPTSQPLSDDQVKLKAMRVPVIHLLAMRPMRLERIAEKTRVGREDLEGLLKKVGQEREGKWELVNRSYKELDVWNFKYPSQEDRQAAVDNAIKAFDRLRVGKEEKVWQLLLKPEERGKGKVLSKLHLGTAAGGSTPALGTSPLPGGNGSQAGSTAGTPVVGAAKKSAAAKQNSEQMKRIFNKDPKRAREAEEAKSRKRKEREATASDVEGKKAAKKQASAVKGPPAKKIKSAELVQSSDDEDEEEGEVKEKVPPSRPKPSPARVAAPAKTVKPKASSSDSSDVPVKQVRAVEKLQVSKRKDTPEASPAAKPAKPTPVTGGKSTPRTNGLTAPSNKNRQALSPQKPDRKPYAPSPLGAARPRVASDVSDRNAVGVQRTKNASGNSSTPQRHGVSSASARKRQDTVTSATSSSSNGPEPRSSSNESSQDKARKAVAKPTTTTGTHNASVAKPVVATSKDETSRNAAKRKRDDDPTTAIADDDTTTKHRKTDSSSTRSSTSTTTNSTATGSKPSPPDEAVFDSGSSDAAGSSASSAIVGDNRDSTMSFRQAVSVAQNFKAYYPAYEELWEKLEGMRVRGETLPEKEVSRLWVMQERLAEMKRDIQEASRGRDGG